MIDIIKAQIHFCNAEFEIIQTKTYVRKGAEKVKR